MIFRETKIEGVWEIELEPHGDTRGFFMRTYDQEIFAKYGLPTDWAQESHAFTRSKGTVRGLHFLHPPSTESKLIYMVAGEGFWTFLDLRKNSPTLGEWGTVILSTEKHNMLFIPRGFANAVCTLTDNCHTLYHMDMGYEDSAKGEIKWDDPELGIPWPIKNPANISERDRNAGSFKEFLEKTGGGLEL